MLPKLVHECAIKGFTASLLRNISSFFLPCRVWLSENNCVILHQMKLYHHEKFIELKSSTALYENRGNWAQCRNGKVNWKIEFQASMFGDIGLLLPKFLWPNVRKICSSHWEKLAKSLISLEQFIQTAKGQNNFCQQCFLICSWRFIRSNKLEQLEFKLEKNIRI